MTRTDDLDERNRWLLAWAAQKAQEEAILTIADFAEDPLLLLDGPGAERGAGKTVKLAALSVDRRTAALLLREALAARAAALCLQVQGEIAANWQTTEAEFAQARRDYAALAAAKGGGDAVE
ncbi:MAG: hypothetical protein K2Q06_12180 [Parvularculaceae bacterium]|nr:hypothetical protein [Parvularculaceae bacterium]